MMKLTYSIIALIVVGIVTYFLLDRRTNFDPREQDTLVIEPEFDQNPYLDLRDQAFQMTKEQLELPGDEELFGIIMDWDLGAPVRNVTRVIGPS